MKLFRVDVSLSLVVVAPSLREAEDYAHAATREEMRWNDSDTHDVSEIHDADDVPPNWMESIPWSEYPEDVRDKTVGQLLVEIETEPSDSDKEAAGQLNMLDA